jgi:hypothetical protein
VSSTNLCLNGVARQGHESVREDRDKEELKGRGGDTVSAFDGGVGRV